MNIKEYKQKLKQIELKTDDLYTEEEIYEKLNELQINILNKNISKILDYCKWNIEINHVMSDFVDLKTNCILSSETNILLDELKDIDNDITYQLNDKLQLYFNSSNRNTEFTGDIFELIKKYKVKINSNVIEENKNKLQKIINKLDELI